MRYFIADKEIPMRIDALWRYIPSIAVTPLATCANASPSRHYHASRSAADDLYQPQFTIFAAYGHLNIAFQHTSTFAFTRPTLHERFTISVLKMLAAYHGISLSRFRD